MRTSLALAIVSASAGYAWSDPHPASAPTPQAAPEPSVDDLIDSGEVIVVTGTRTPERADSAPVKVDVITHDEADRRGATNVADALASQPGVQVNPGAYGYLGGVSAIQIQGFDLNRVLILEDGEPVIGDVGGAIDLAAIPMSDVERIEVVTGPTSALYGSSAIGGVVNIITGPPKLQGESARARVEYRSYRGVVVDGMGAYRDGVRWGAADVSYVRQDGIVADPALPDLQIPKTARSVVGVRVGTRLARTDLQLRARWLHQRADGIESKAFPGLGRFETQLPSLTNRYALHALATTHLGDDDTTSPILRISAAVQHATDASATVGPGVDQTQRSTQTLPSLEGTTTIPDGPRTWVVGARFETQHLEQHLEDRATSDATQAMIQEVAPHWLWSIAGFGQLQWKLGDVVTVLPGVRAEDHGSYGAVVAPRLAVSITPSPMWTARVSGGRGYRVPSAEELGFNFDHSIYGYKVVGNPELAPESSWGINGDVTVRPVDDLVLRAGAFANWVDNLIDIDLASGMTMGSVVTYSYANFERARTLGGQASAAYRIGERVTAELSYDYLWTRNDVSDEPLSGMPAHTVTGSLRVRLPLDIDAYARARVVGRAYVDAMTSSPGYETVNLRLSRAVWRDVEAEAGANNLFDVHQTLGVVGDLRPPLGRIIYAGVRAAFP